MRAQITGKGIGSSLSPTSWGDLTDTTPGIAALARVIFVVLTVWVVMRPERVIDPATQLPALALPGLAVATFGFSRSGGQLALLGYAAGIAHALGDGRVARRADPAGASGVGGAWRRGSGACRARIRPHRHTRAADHDLHRLHPDVPARLGRDLHQQSRAGACS
jgi:hypothetical protein